MQKRMTKLFLLALLAIGGGSALIQISQAQKSDLIFAPQIPKTWDEAELAEWATPLAGLNQRPTHISA